jgi:hypothetical protein
MVVGFIAGLFVGLGVAYLMHVFYPLHDLQGFVVGIFCILGLGVGALLESRSGTK